MNCNDMAGKKIWQIIFPLLVGICVFALNISYSSGPSYLQDEIGYLSKSALLAGKVVDGSSSYHGGVSMLISPAFLLSDPPQIWLSIIAINAIVCGASVRLIFDIANFYASTTDQLTLRGAFFLAVIYPATWVMSGYIFPSIYLGLFFLLVVWCLLQEYNKTGWGILSALLVGFIYWMHPTGLVVCIAFVLTQVVLHWKKSDKSVWGFIFLQLIIVGLMVVFYKLWIHPYMNILMTPGGQSIKSHYGGFSGQFEKLTSLPGIFGVIRAVFGQLSYLVISTFGLGFLGLVYLSINSWNLIIRGEVGGRGGVNIFILLSVLGLLTMGRIAMSVPGRIDHIVYGRYQEISYTLLIFFGFLYCVKANAEEARQKVLRAPAILISLIIFAELVFIYFGLEEVGQHNNIVNTIGMYPQYLFEKSDLMLWLAVGLSGALLLLLIGPWSYIPIMLVFSIIAISNQVTWHKSILEGHSKPSALISLITDETTPGACVAFDVDSMDAKELSLRQKEQFNMFKFYLSSYQYKRMSFSAWLDGCEGPLLTYYPENYVDNKDIIVRAKDFDLGLFMISRLSNSQMKESRGRPGLYINSGNNEECLLGGCFEMHASKLINFSQNGIIKNGHLVEDVSRGGGYLFYGPYNKMKKGSWRVDLEFGRFSEGEYVFDVVSERGSVIHAEKIPGKSDRNNGGDSLFFDLNEDVADLEVRLRVVKAGNIAVKRYVVIGR